MNVFNAHYRVRGSNGTGLRDTYPLHQRSHGDVKELCVRFWRMVPSLRKDSLGSEGGPWTHTDPDVRSMAGP